MENKSPESIFSEACASVNEACERCLEDLEDQVHRAPLQSVLFAILAGYVMAILPLGRILWGVTRAALFFAKPALLIAGLFHLANLLRQQCGGPARTDVREPLVDSPAGPSV